MIALKKLILGLLIIGSGALAEWKYIQGIDNGSFAVYKTDRQVIRQFKTQKDGYVNIVPSPSTCLEQMYLLDGNNKIIGQYNLYGKRLINEQIRAGNYYIQIIPKDDCKINVALPQ